MTTKTRQNKIALSFLAITFLAPVIAAATILNTGWYQTLGTTNRGTLVTPPIPIQSIAPKQANELLRSHHWKVLFIEPTHCDIACENTRYLLKQIELAMGADRNRVETLALAPDNREQINHRLGRLFENNVPPTESGHLYLVDPAGNIFMHYPAHAERQDAILEGKGIIKDLQHALKLSRIG